MHYRTLGKTGITVSEIGFGAWGIGGLTEGATSYGKTSDAESRRALRRAFDFGISFYDTSNIYGNGHSETLIGEVFQKRRDQIVIATKGGMLKHRGVPDVSPRNLRVSLEESLRRLRTDYVDLYQLHAPPLALVQQTPGVMETLRAFKREGKARALGFSVQKPEEGISALCDLGFDVVQVNYNLIDRRAEDSGLLALAEKREAGIIARTPLCFGFLSEPLALRFGARDHRSVWHPRQRAAWRRAAKLFTAFNRERSRTLVQLALKFCITHPAISTAIPGILHPAEAEENAAASALPPLSVRECAELRRIYNQNSFFYKDLKPA